jgi:hypothetical protein
MGRVFVLRAMRCGPGELRRCLMRALLLLLGAAALRAHEPHLLLTDHGNGTFTAEAGFSDGASPEGLKLLLRERSTGAVLAEHTLPASGKLTLPRPGAPYRVVFDAGPGHRVSKPGPWPESEPATAPVAADKAAVPAAMSAAAAAKGSAAASGAAGAGGGAAGTSDAAGAAATPVAAEGAGETARMALVAGVFFLFGTAAFALGHAAGRRAR